MAEIDWEGEVNATQDTPADVLGWFLAKAEHIDALVVIAHVTGDAPEQYANSVLCRSNVAESYVRLGLLHDALNIQRANDYRGITSFDAED